MQALTIGAITFVFTFGGALLGIYCRGVVVPDAHLDSESKNIVTLSTGLIATMTAVVLGLVVASAKSSFDATTVGIANAAAQVLEVDRLLGRYGPETSEIRDLLRRVVAYRIDSAWPEDKVGSAKLDDPEMARTVEGLEDQISQLSPQNDRQRWLQSRALTACSEALRGRWLLLGSRPGVPVPFLVALIFWLTMIFAAFGLMAPRNATVIGSLLVSALSVAVSMFLVLEMEDAFDGVIKVSSVPLRFALSHLGN